MTDTDDLLPALLASFDGTLVERLGIELLTADAGRVVARMPVAGNTQPFGLLHGGATAALAETVGSVAATIHAGPGRHAVGTELSATHHRSARDGYVTATATPLHLGRRTASYDVAVVDDAGRRVCTARLSCMILEQSGGPGRA
jgi:1,4-dihydroxy-2-naphthoyl-CoA hydrolase